MTYAPQVLTVTSTDRILNKLPVAVESATSLDANRLMYLLDSILSGQYRSMPKQWTTLTRPVTSPTPPTAAVQVGEIGFNTDHSSLELYTGVTYGWLIMAGIWTDLSLAPITDTAPGSRGWIIGIGAITYDGTTWNLGS